MTALETYPHRWLPATTPGLPTLLLLHGTGGTEDAMLDVGAAVLPGAARLSPLGLVREHGMARWFRRFAEGQLDLEDLAFRTAELGGWLRTALVHYGVAEQPVIYVGYSNGANMAAALLMAGAVPAQAAALLRPYDIPVPDAAVRLDGIRIQLQSGGRDRITPTAHAAQLAGKLAGLGASVAHEVDPELGHELTLADLKRAQRFLRGN